jgi:hypothetical protein
LKYSTSEREARIVRDAAGRVSLSDHALHRFAERTPHDCRVSIREAWRRGEQLQHPDVASALDEPEPERARVFRRPDWGVVFVVDERRERAGRIVVTVCGIKTYDYGPARAYLRAHGPHGQGER